MHFGESNIFSHLFLKIVAKVHYRDFTTQQAQRAIRARKPRNANGRETNDAASVA
jgi:hypothetical protein